MKLLKIFERMSSSLTEGDSFIAVWGPDNVEWLDGSSDDGFLVALVSPGDRTPRHTYSEFYSTRSGRADEVAVCYAGYLGLLKTGCKSGPDKDAGDLFPAYRAAYPDYIFKVTPNGLVNPSKEEEDALKKVYKWL